MAITVRVKKRKPTDSTLRNVRASRKRESAILRRLERLEAKVRRLKLALR